MRAFAEEQSELAAADDAPREAPAVAPVGAVASLDELIASGRATPEAAAAIVRAFPGDLDALMAEIHPRLGNGFASETMQLASAAPAAAKDTAVTGTVADVLGLERGDGMTAASAGMRPRVKELQKRLNAAMDAELAIDGMYGPLTGRATRELQASLRQPSQELIDPVTADALFGVAPPEVTASPPGQQIEPEAARMTAAADAAAAWSFTLGKAGGSLSTTGQKCITSFGDIAPAGGPLMDAGDQLSALGPVVLGWSMAFQGAAAPGAAGPKTIGNPLVGVTEGDGLVFGTQDRRNRVRRLQTALNEHGAGLVVDGRFGAKTRAALDAFRTPLSLAPSNAVDADTADHLLGQGTHTPQAGNPDAARLTATGLTLSTSAAHVVASAQALSQAGAALQGASSGDLFFEGVEMMGAGSDLAVMANALLGIGQSLTGTELGPVGLVARQVLREMVTTMTGIGAALSAAGAHISGAGSAIATDFELLAVSSSLQQSGSQLLTAGNVFMKAGSLIAPVGPTGGGKAPKGA